MSLYDPRNRKEIYYRGILDGDNSLPDPQTREELFLKAIAEAMPIITEATVVQTTGTSATTVMSQKAVTDEFNGRFNGVVSSGSVNDLNDNGGYLLLTGVADLPENISFASLFVNSSNGRFVFKILMCDSGKVYTSITDTQGPYIQVGWELLNADLPSETYRGKKIVNFGDSIFGNFQGTTPGTYQSISSMMAGILKADCVNAGFGGCRMTSITPTAAPWLNPFCMDELAEAIRTNNWTDADDAITNHSGDLPDYFPDTLAIIKAIDWSDVSAVTISYGTNDWSANVNENDFKNAIYLGVQRLMQVNPKIKFFLLSPIYRWFDNGGNFDYDSDSAQAVNANSNTIPQFVQWCKEAAASLHIPFIDNYYSLGFCQLTIPVYYGTDTTHPIEDGRKLMAEHICAGMNATY